jgi:predicted aconitase
MLLSDEEKKMLEGEYGIGTQRAMSFLNRLGEALNAEKMVRVTSAHIHSFFPTEFLERMTEDVIKPRALVSLMPDFDPVYWRKKHNLVAEEGDLIGGVALTNEKDHAKNMDICKKLGFLPTFTCTPYTVGIVPRRNDVCIWAGSSGQTATNSMFGGRAPRHSSATAIASAIAGVIPYVGLVKPENRYAELLINTEDLDIANFTISDYGVLGYFVGGIAEVRNVVFDGLPSTMSLEQCKYLTSPLTVSGACTMCHIIGVTPEAPTLEAALGGKQPKEVVKVTSKDLQEIRNTFTNAGADEIELAVFGCPHCTIMELAEMAYLLEGKRLKERAQLMVGISNMTYTLAKEAGYIDPIEKAGAIVTNGCVSGLNPLVHISGVNFVATNSIRAAHFFQATTAGRCRTYYRDVRDCINAVTTDKRSY